MLSNQREIGRELRRARVRKKILGSDARPRLCVYRSLKHIYAQVISDERGATLVSASTISKEMQEKLGKMKRLEAAREVGRWLAERCQERNVVQVVFDRNGFLYHGRVKALAEGARERGLVF